MRPDSQAPVIWLGLFFRFCTNASPANTIEEKISDPSQGRADRPRLRPVDEKTNAVLGPQIDRENERKKRDGLLGKNTADDEEYDRGDDDIDAENRDERQPRR